jgi:hypothetical protein
MRHLEEPQSYIEDQATAHEVAQVQEMAHRAGAIALDLIGAKGPEQIPHPGEAARQAHDEMGQNRNTLGVRSEVSRDASAAVGEGLRRMMQRAGVTVGQYGEIASETGHGQAAERAIRSAYDTAQGMIMRSIRPGEDTKTSGRELPIEAPGTVSLPGAEEFRGFRADNPDDAWAADTVRSFLGAGNYAAAPVERRVQISEGIVGERRMVPVGLPDTAGVYLQEDHFYNTASGELAWSEMALVQPPAEEPSRDTPVAA